MKLIINADDFGSTERHTARIVELLACGKISSTTFLVNLPYSAQAAADLRAQHPDLVGKVGLHLNLTQGLPLNEALWHTPFVHPNRDFHDFRRRVPFWKQLPHFSKLRHELDLQIERFHALMGRYPTHLDSHGHTHCTIALLYALLTSKQARHIKTIRLTRQYDHEPKPRTGFREMMHRIARKTLNAAFRIRFKTTGYFADIHNLDGTWLGKAQLDYMAGKFDVIEVMCHPYYFDDSDYEFLIATPNVFEQYTGLTMASYEDF
jgi:predicted glycoside hydrolase/deacetylase ChbG (UPF0249 family)